MVHAVSGLLDLDQLLGSRPTHTWNGKTEGELHLCDITLVGVCSLPQNGESEGRLLQIAERDSKSRGGVCSSEV